MPTKQHFNTDARTPTMGYSEAVRFGDTVYVAGTVGTAEDGSIPSTMEEQMRCAYARIERRLAGVGATLADVVEQTVYVTDIGAAQEARKVRMEIFSADAGFPTSTLVEVSRLAVPEFLVEIRVTARIAQTA